MEKFNLKYSIKNITIPSERSYIMQFIEKVETFIKRIRWKAIYYDNKNKNDNNFQETYGIKSRNSPPQVKELSAFEDDLFHLVKIIKFRKFKNKLQEKMNEDLQLIKSSTKTMTPADKTSNMYSLTKEEYNKLLDNAITKTYKKQTVK